MENTQDKVWFKLEDRDLVAARPHGHMVKTHFVCGALAESVSNTIGSAHGVNLSITPLKQEIRFEIGGFGMYLMEQPRYTMDVDDLALTIDCLKFDETISTLMSAAVYETIDGKFKYVRLISRFCNLVLSVEQANSLREQMLFKLSKAREEATVCLNKITGIRKELTAAGHYIFVGDEQPKKLLPN